MVDREGLKRLLDEASEAWLEEVYPALRVLLGHPRWPVDDEEVTEEEAADIRAAEEEIARGEWVSWDKVKRHERV
jgi:hypothetical protein